MGWKNKIIAALVAASLMAFSSLSHANGELEYVTMRVYMNPVGAPLSFIEEDVPLNMVLVSDLGHKLGIATPVTDLLIDLSNLVRQKDFRVLGTKAETLGIQSLDKESIRALIGIK